MPRRLVLATVAACLAALPASASWHCTTIARRGQLDPRGRPFGTRFEAAAVNGAGDLVFAARPGGGPPRLYHATPTGALDVVVSGGDPSPGGAPFGRFSALSLNEAGDVAFLADLPLGKGVFTGPLAGPFVTAAVTGLPLPTGGTIARILSVSRVNASGDVGLVLHAAGGPDGVFVHRRATGTLVAVAAAGDASADGRRLCTAGFARVGLGDSGAVAFRALWRHDCDDAGEPLRTGLFLARPGLGIAAVAAQDETAPLPGTTFRTFWDEPEVNAADQVGFRADVHGASTRAGVFRFDPATGETTILAQTAAPVPGGAGTLATLGPARLDDDGATLFHARVTGGTVTQGVFRMATGASEVVALGNEVPTDGFAAGAAFRPVGPLGASRNGGWVAYVAKVRNVTAPVASAGVFRCRR